MYLSDDLCDHLLHPEHRLWPRLVFADQLHRDPPFVIFADFRADCGSPQRKTKDARQGSLKRAMQSESESQNSANASPLLLPLLHEPAVDHMGTQRYHKRLHV